MTTAQDRGWGTPGCSSGQLSRVAVDGMVDATPLGAFPLRVRKEVAPLFAELVRWLVAERKRRGLPPLACAGGYIKRYMAGTTTWSNHSWGLAADFNAGANPMQSTLRTDMPPGTGDKARSLGMRWGGEYVGRKDPMHFEFVGTPDEAARLVASLRPSRDRAPVQEDDDVTPEQLADLKRHITGAVDAAIANTNKRVDDLDAQVKILRRDARELGKAAGLKTSGATDGVVGN